MRGSPAPLPLRGGDLRLALQVRQLILGLRGDQRLPRDTLSELVIKNLERLDTDVGDVLHLPPVRDPTAE